MENCQVCKEADCSTDSLDILINACSDNLTLSSLLSVPLSTSTDTNEFIDIINSDFNYQLAQMTLFQFPNHAESVYKLIILYTTHSFFILKSTYLFSNDFVRNFLDSKTENRSVQTQACFLVIRFHSPSQIYHKLPFH